MPSSRCWASRPSKDENTVSLGKLSLSFKPVSNVSQPSRRKHHPDRRTEEADKPNERKQHKHIVSVHDRSPLTPAGKAVVAYNATKHGLLSRESLVEEDHGTRRSRHRTGDADADRRTGAATDVQGCERSRGRTLDHRHQRQHHVLRRDGPQHRAVGHQRRHYHGLRPDGSPDRHDQEPLKLATLGSRNRPVSHLPCGLPEKS